MRGPWASLLTRSPSAHGGQGWQRPSPGPVRVSAPPPQPSGLPPGSTSHPLGKRPLTGSGFGLRPLHPLPPPLRIAGRASPRATGRGYYRRGRRWGGKFGCGKGQGVVLTGFSAATIGGLLENTSHPTAVVIPGPAAQPRRPRDPAAHERSEGERAAPTVPEQIALRAPLGPGFRRDDDSRGAKRPAP